MNNRDAIVQDTIALPLDPMEEDNNLNELACRYAGYLVPPNDAPINSSPVEKSDPPPKLTSEKNRFGAFVPGCFEKPVATNSDHDAKPAAKNLKKPPPKSSFSLCPSFHDDASSTYLHDLYIYRQPFKLESSNMKKAPDSTHSSVTYAWDSPSYCRQILAEKKTNNRDDATTASYPSFYSPSVHSTSSGSVAPAAPIEILIAPGVTATLRGAIETTKAVQQNYITRVPCWGGCPEGVFCIADCRWALCSQCRTISPNDDTGLEALAHGCGLGLTRETLTSLQAEAFGTAAGRR